jgi:16S rRNA (cytosine967-C5)-methyltransferase
MADLASRILARAVEAVAPGGRIVYSVCTISRQEGEAVVGATGIVPDDLAADPANATLASPGEPTCLQTRTDRDRTDGFFVARLRP